jgi:DNA-binding Lrp family transcriptional regulator
MNLSLNSNDLKIISLFASKDFISQFSCFPPQNETAEKLNCSYSTYWRREEKLVNSYVLNCSYRFNPSKLGYETHLLISKGESPLESNSYCLADVPFDYGHKMGRLQILQIPIWKQEIYMKFYNSPKKNRLKTLTDAFIGWNLNALTAKPEKRWCQEPPILTHHNWDSSLIGESKGITYDLTPTFNTPQLNKLEVKVLNTFGKYGARYETVISSQLNVTEKYITEVWKKIFDSKLLHRFAVFSNIGLKVKPWITLQGKLGESNENSRMLKNIIEHLKLFPFSYLYYKLHDDEDKSNGGPFLTGLIYLPPHWVTDFSSKWLELSKYGFHPKIDFSRDRVIKWNIDLANTYF